MDIVVLILAAIFFFVVAVLFRSNEALDRVSEVEKEVAEIEKGTEKEEGPAAAIPEPDVPAEDKPPSQNPIDNAAFPKPEDVHMN